MKGLIISERRPTIPGGGAQSVAELLDATVAEHPDRLALVGRHGRLTYAELDRAVNRAAGALALLGIGTTDRVAVCLPNDVDIVIAFLATQRLGAIWVGLNRPLAGPEKAHILRDCGARIYLCDEELRGEVESARAEIPELEHVIGVDPDDSGAEWSERLRAVEAASFPQIEIDPFAPCAIAYTSGTTGFPKGAVHSQHNLLMPGAVSRLTGNRPRPLQHGVVLPLTILNLMVLGPICIFYDGRCCVCMDRIDALGVAEWVRDERIGSFDGVPTIIHDLLTHPDVKQEDLTSLTEPIMGGADSPPEVVRLFRERFGGEVIIGYGMTEAPTAVSWSDGEVPPGPGLCGRPVPQVEIEIHDEEGKVLSPGEVGEICVRPARQGELAGVYTPMLGYWNNPKATAEALAEGVYHTGDLGFFADDGNLYIRGRRNELILRGGANIYPAEVERILQQHPSVSAAAVLGLADERLGERVVAVVQLEPGQEAGEEALRSHTQGELARYKVPDVIRFTEEMPRNAMNKIVKKKLLSLFE
ncbi:MAG: AMP-binding protein [Deltaproteobacteria bacterium]|nr:AMP-binding protein [Deltaproteobacteria bacterium]MBW2385770.1 AMP-binding protein [Deltaproteobacteria bacterium]